MKVIEEYIGLLEILLENEIRLSKLTKAIKWANGFFEGCFTFPSKMSWQEHPSNPTKFASGWNEISRHQHNDECEIEGFKVLIWVSGLLNHELDRRIELEISSAPIQFQAFSAALKMGGFKCRYIEDIGGKKYLEAWKTNPCEDEDIEIYVKCEF